MFSHLTNVSRVSDVDPTDREAAREAPPPQHRRRPVVWIGAVVVAALVAVAVWVIGTGDDQPQAASTQAALEGAPSLQDLAEQAESPSSDDAAPDFSVPTADGEAFTLSRHLAADGRPVILNLWASWCFPCRAEMPAIDDFAASHPEIAVVGVAVQDDVVAAEEFAEELGVSYIIGFDEKDEVNDGYRPLGLPATFFIAPDGTVVKRHFGTVTAESLAEDVAALFG